jgi:hypothetical protein
LRGTKQNNPEQHGNAGLLHPDGFAKTKRKNNEKITNNKN